MKRVVTNIQRIVYTLTQDEVVDAIVKAHSLSSTPNRFTFRSDGSVEFVYDFVEGK